jgi:MOSC domain-containing protein YiiM
MRELSVVTISTDSGLEGDCRGKPGKRQVTVISAEAWNDACADLNVQLPWMVRRANLLLSGLRFTAEHVGKVLAIGEVRLLITRETDPCRRMDEAHQGLRFALTPQWRGGVCCKVLQAGRIALGDSVTLVDPVNP